MRTHKVPSVKYSRKIRSDFERELPELIQRFELIEKNMLREHLSLSPMATTYLNQAYLCYLHGLYMPFLIMLSFAFEALFRAMFKQARFKTLINYAKKHRIITNKECQEIHWLRNCRNAITHIVDQIPTHPRRDYEVNFYQTTDADVLRMAKRAFKLVPVFNKIQWNSIGIMAYLGDKEDRREPPDLSYMLKKRRDAVRQS